MIWLNGDDNNSSRHSFLLLGVPPGLIKIHPHVSLVPPGLSGILLVLILLAPPNAWRCPTARPRPALPRTCASIKINMSDSQGGSRRSRRGTTEGAVVVVMLFLLFSESLRKAML